MTLAALKRKIQPGTRLVVLSHWQEKYLGTERVVTKTQGNGYWFTMEGDDRRYWSPYPKASMLAFPSDDSFTVLPDSKGHGWTLRIL